MATSLKLYDSSLAEITAELSSVSADAGTASAATELVVINNKDGSGADTASGFAVVVQARLTDASPFQSEGLEPLSGFWVEARIASGYNQTLSTSAWKGLGPGSVLDLPDMPNDQGVRFEFRLNPATATADTAFDGHLAIADSRSATSPAVAFETGGGIRLSLGDRDVNELISWSGDVVANPAGADHQVQTPDVVAMVQGVPSSRLLALEALDANDSAAAALASGESYIAALSLASDGTITVTKGLKATQPVGESNRPAALTTEPLLAWVERPFSALITSSEITNVLVGRYAGVTTSLLNATIAPFNALISDRVVNAANAQPVAMTISSTNSIWLRRDGSPGATTDGLPPSDSPQALLAYEIDTDATTATATRDYREFVGANELDVEFKFTATLVVDQYSYASLPNGRYFIHPHKGITASLADAGAGATSGQTVFDLEYWDGSGSAFVSVFTSQTTSVPDRGASIAYDSTALTSDGAIPEIWNIDGPAVVRCRVAEIPTGGSPASASVTLRMVK